MVAEGEDPSSILCLTFTRKAAEEMRDRAQALFSRRCGFRTFHSLAYLFSYTYNPLLLDEVDYDQMLTSTVARLREDPLLRQKWQYKWLMVDEANDLTLEQVELLQLLSEEHGNVFLVGDANQAIFGFAGATPEPMVHFEKYFPGGRYLTLGVNYRSTKRIVDLCRRLAPIQTELLERLNTSNEVGEPPTFEQYGNNVAEIYGASGKMNPNESNMLLARTNKQLKLAKDLGMPATTIHKAKGREWDNVWVIGCQDGLLPLAGADEEEEARLLFVAASRAAKRLHFSCYGTPSKFLTKFLEDGTIERSTQ